MDDEDRTREQPHLVSYIISPPVKQEMAEGGGKPIAVIISPAELEPGAGVGPGPGAGPGDGPGAAPIPPRAGHEGVLRRPGA